MKKLVIAIVAALALPAFADDLSDQIRRLQEEQKKSEIEHAKSEAKYQARQLELEVEIKQLELKQLAQKATDTFGKGPELPPDAKEQVEKLQAAFEEYVKWAQDRLKEGVKKAVDKVREGTKPEEEPAVHEEPPKEHTVGPKPPKNDAQTTYRDAVKKYDDGSFEDAAKMFAKAAEAKFEPAASRYNEACSWALAGNAEKAMEALSQAVEAGYDDVDHIEEDSDLESLHENPKFQELVKQLRK